MDDAFRSGLLSITIPVPFEEPRHQGIYAATKESGTIYFRVNEFDNILINKIAKDLELKVGTFARFCVLRSAQKLEEHQNAYLESLKSRR